jgi:hypothetical protein
MPLPVPIEFTEIAFFERATKYYIAGRYAALAGLFPVCANLLHHAIEMYLKGALSRSQSIDELRDMKHNLKRIWRAFRADFPEPRLVQFDASVSALHKFERLRYPNEELKKGMLGQFSFLRVDATTLKSSGKTPPPFFSLVLEDVDHLVKSIFQVASVNPHFYLVSASDAALRYLAERNEHPFPPAA